MVMVELFIGMHALLLLVKMRFSSKMQKFASIINEFLGHMGAFIVKSVAVILDICQSITA